MDYYEVLFLHPKTGNRFLIQGVQAEVENKHDFLDAPLVMGFKRKTPIRTWLEIKLTIATPSDHSMVNELKEQIEAEDLFLYFKDVHPNLIRGIVTNITMDYQKTEIQFTGNATNKTYYDFVEETQKQLEAYQYLWESKTTTNSAYLNLEPNEQTTKPIVKERKAIIIKRKLTF